MSKASKRDIATAIVRLNKTYSRSKLSNAVAAYLSTERRTNELDAIMRDVKQLRQQTNGVVEVDITTAFPASNKVKAQIEQLLDTKNIIMNEIIDQNVIGGVRIESNDVYVDLTVRGRLDRFKTSKTGAKV